MKQYLYPNNSFEDIFVFKRYIIIGAAPTNDLRSHGGTTILVKQLLDYFNEKNLDYIFIQTNKYKGKISAYKNYIYVVFNFIKHIKSKDIVFVNVASNGMYFLSPILLMISKKYHKKFISRNFGGNSIELYEDVNKIKKKLITYLFKESDILFFETRYLVKYFKSVNSSTYWFPNSRKNPKVIRDENIEFKKEFVFIGHIREEKGIDEILEASTYLDDSYTIILYGNIVEEKYNDELWNKYKNIKYGGQLKHSEVYETLAKYDVLLLPSHREGYPGVIIEAFSVGLPVIATKLPSIQEMVDEKCGMLINVKDSSDLADSMQALNKKDYSTLSKNAFEKFEKFEYEKVYKDIIKICEVDK